MKKLSLLFVAAVAMLTGCVKVTVEGDDNTGGGTTPTSNVLEGTIDASRTLTRGTYILKGYVYVNNGATLTIEAGSIIKSDVSRKGALIIEKGSKLIADGKADAPIVFTSGKPSGERQPGDWGGIILLGNAPTNRTTPPLIEGGVNRPYGGSDANDNSGILRFVRIEFAGIAAEPGSEINALTCGGVGAGTILENIQTSYANDDAYEFFGGTVNAKNLVAFATADDDFDFDFGYVGKIQFAVSFRDKFADSDAANGIECDNDGTGTSAAPYTRPVLSNFTLIGPYDTTGAASTHNFSNRWRRATRFSIRNSILMGHRRGGFSMESASTVNDYKNGISEFKNNIIAVYADPYRLSDASAQGAMTVAELRAKAESEGCTTLANREAVQLVDPFNLRNPNFLPATGSPALSGANFTGADAFFTTTTYRGAFGTTNWTAGWTNWNPQTAAY